MWKKQRDLSSKLLASVSPDVTDANIEVCGSHFTFF